MAFLPIFILLALGLQDARAEFELPPPGLLRRNVQFWIEIYSKLDTRQGVFHDAKNVDVVYEQLDFHSGSKSAKIRQARKRIREVLMRLHHSGVENDPTRANVLKGEEKAIYDAFALVTEKNKFLNAAHPKRLRFQLGQRDRFLEGLEESGKYLKAMEAVFKREGLPTELTRLPFVESSFNTKARSKVGASGIWQFMRATARNFLTLSEGVDERDDPLRATEAAAKLLKINYDSLGSWPLAVTAYNHGRTGLMKAVRRLGSNQLEDIMTRNKARGFGFASSNFYACFLAAVEVERNAERYFPEGHRKRPDLEYIEVPLPQAITLKQLLFFMKPSRQALLELNPGITTAGLKSRAPLPVGYRLRLPQPPGTSPEKRESNVRVFLATFEKIPRLYKGRQARDR